MKKVYPTFGFSLLFLMLLGCTKQFDSFNTNPYGVTDASAAQDFNNIGSYLGQLQQNIYTVTADLQLDENLVGDVYAQYLVPPTPFVSNKNNVTYKITYWDAQWNKSYEKVMPVLMNYKLKGVDVTYPQFYAWATVLKIFTMQRTTDNYGPIIYSNYGTTSSTINYDSQRDVYYKFFEELDSAIPVLSKYADDRNSSFTNFDLAYGGDVSKWVKAANSLRLRLAMRISKVDKGKAQLEAEKAIAQKYGVITDNSSNLFVSVGSRAHPLGIICFNWGDTRMCATMESILKGFNDPRLQVYFSPNSDPLLVSGDYKGIRQGIDISSKSTYLGFSEIGQMYKTAKTVQIMTAAEVNFLQAEGALRGWNMGSKSAEEFYANGVKLSFAQNGVSGYVDYLNDNQSTFLDYQDPINPINSFKASSNITIHWSDADSKEVKLEKIITQKWIACYPDGQEAWSEFRRTGYPKLIPVVVNYSGGTISTDQFIRRMIYPQTEYNTNNTGLQNGLALLGGPDTGGTRVWWDTNTANF